MTRPGPADVVMPAGARRGTGSWQSCSVVPVQVTPVAVPGCSSAPGRDMLCVLASPLRWLWRAGVCNLLVTFSQDPFGSLFIAIAGLAAIFFLFRREITWSVQLAAKLISW